MKDKDKQTCEICRKEGPPPTGNTPVDDDVIYKDVLVWKCGECLKAGK